VRTEGARRRRGSQLEASHADARRGHTWTRWLLPSGEPSPTQHSWPVPRPGDRDVTASAVDLGQAGIGTSVFLLAIGAILAFAVNASISGISLTAVGVILMIAGAIGLVVSLIARNRHTEERVVRDRGHVHDEGHGHHA
jgi:hypothetical protein